MPGMSLPPEPVAATEPSIVQVGLGSLCPRCGAKTLYVGMIKFAPRCTACGLDFDAFNVGDGPAAFLTLIIGTLICIAAITLELTAHPPMWLHIIAVAADHDPRGDRLAARRQGHAARLRISQPRARGTGQRDRRAQAVTPMRIPLLPTILVVAAAGVMVWLGIWQLHRMTWKEGLLAEYRAAAGKPPVAFPRIPTDQSLLFRRSEAFCLQPVGWRASSGRNRAAQPGWRHVADCRTGAEGPGFAVDMGWSQVSAAPVWKGGEVGGIIGPDHDGQVMLVSDTAAPGLDAQRTAQPRRHPQQPLRLRDPVVHLRRARGGHLRDRAVAA